MSEGRQFVVEVMDAQGNVTSTVGVSGLRVVGSRITGATVGAASSIVTFGGNGQSGTVGQPITVPPSVQVVDSKGVGVAGSTVTWLSGGGSGGTSTGNTSTTNANGVATVGSWTMGTVTGSGSSYSLLAYSGNLTNSPIGFVVTSIASGSPFSLAISGGTSQTTTPVGVMASRLSVLVTDQYANILSNATCTITAEDSVASFPSTITTNTSGVAGFLYQGGTSAGTSSVFVNLLGSSTSVTFTSTITSGLANTVTIVSGDGQTALSGTTLANEIDVFVDDGYGNAITSGATIQYVIVLGSGNVSRATQTPVASSGSFTWKMGANAGQNAVEISLANVSNSTVTVFASGTNPVADTLRYLSGGTQTGTVATAAAILEVATLGSGSSASGQVVTWAITSSNATGSLSTDRTASSTSGIARCTFTYGQTVGAYQVQASAGTLTGSPVLFNLTATAGSATSLALATQPLVNTQAGVAWSQQPVVVSTDVYGNLVSTNTRVQAVLTSGAGTLDSGVSTYATASGATATFSGLSYNGSGAYQTAYRCNSLSTATANAQNGAPPFASQLGFNVQPGAIQQGGFFSPTVQVAVQDSNGATVTTATNQVSLAISGAGVLTGITSRNAVAGVATFGSMGVTAGTATGNYTLAATATGLTGATSSAFAVSAPGAYNEPAGMTQIAHLDMSNGLPTGWAGVGSYIVTQPTDTIPLTSLGTQILNPGSGPVSGGPFVRGKFNSGLSGGVGAFQRYMSPNFGSAGYTEIYRRYAFALSSNWQYGSKIMFLMKVSTKDNQNTIYSTLNPTNGNFSIPRYEIRIQGGVHNVGGNSASGNRNISASPVCFLQLNTWYIFEEYLKMNTPGAADGIIKVWITSPAYQGGATTLAVNVSDAAITQAGQSQAWLNTNHNPTFGIAGDRCPDDQYHFVDDLYISGKV